MAIEKQTLLVIPHTGVRVEADFDTSLGTFLAQRIRIDGNVAVFYKNDLRTERVENDKDFSDTVSELTVRYPG